MLERPRPHSTRRIATLAVIVIALGFAGAIIARRVAPARRRLSVAATTILALLGAAAPAIAVAQLPESAWRDAGLLAAAAGGSIAAVHVGALVNATLLDRARERRARLQRPAALEVLARWADRHPVRVAGVNASAVGIRSIQRIIDVRVTGLAAEMSYYGLISLVPLTTALGASLGYLERIVGAEQVQRVQQALVDALAQVFADQVARDVLEPLVAGLLDEERTGFAVGGLLVTLWLASRMFRAAIRALDDAYAVDERRGVLTQQVLGLALALGAIVTLITLLAMIVIGPLLGDGPQIADRFGLGGVFEFAWSTLRWPAAAALCVSYLVLLYRYAPNVDNRWTQCLVGGAVGSIGLLAVAIGFGIYLRVAGPSVSQGITTESAAVSGAAQTIGLVLVGVLWLWLSSIAILAGGVVNAEVGRERERERAG